MAWLLWQKNTNIKRVRSVNGGEYMGKEFQNICIESGIIHKTTSPHTPEHNGITERYNRTLQEGALTIWHDARLSGRFWVSIIHMINFVKNWILHSHLSISPYQALWGMKPRIDWFRTYGSKCWALILKATQTKNQLNWSREHLWVICWGTYAYMHICTKSIQIYFGIFFDFILVLLSFHCSHTVPIFSNFFPIFPAILFTSKACHFDMALLILLPFKHPHSRTSCGIKSYYTQCTRSLRCAEQSWSRGRKQGI